MNNTVGNILQVVSAILAILYFCRDILSYWYKEFIEKRLTYKHLYNSHIKLIRKINENFHYDIVCIVNIHGFLIPNFIYDLLESKECLHIYCFKKGNIKDSSLFEDFMHKIESEKWILFIPKVLDKCADKSILILDDFCVSGNSLIQIKKHLKSKNISQAKTASLFVSDVCEFNGNCPDFYQEVKDIRIKPPYDKVR